MNKYKVLTLSIISALTVSACDTTSTPNIGANPSTAINRKVLPVGDVNCQNGGVEVSTGIDTNSNAVLDESEVSATEYICHGSNGLDGSDGADGADGADGQDAFNSLINISAVSFGDSNCSTGGALVEAGLDQNRNTILELSEVFNSSYICNGSDGVNGQDGLDADFSNLDLPPVIHTIHSENIFVSTNSTTNLTVTASDPLGQSPLNYSWRNLTYNYDVIGNSATVEVTTGSNQGSEIYMVTVTDASGNQETGYVTIEVIASAITIAPIQEVCMDTRAAYISNNLIVHTGQSGNITGSMLSAGINQEVAGFTIEKPALNGELNAVDVLNTTLTSITSSISTISNIANSVGVNSNVRIAQYVISTATPVSPMELSNLIIQDVGVNTVGGTINNLPVPAAGAVTDTVFRLSITAEYNSPTSVVLIVSVTPEAEVVNQSQVLVPLNDSSNINICNLAPSLNNESFIGSGSGGLADILFVIDNSGSMSNQQMAISQAASDFVFAMGNSGLDYNMGVITTDSDLLRGAGFTTDATVFSSDVVAGTSGSWTETGIWYAEQALQSVLLGDTFDGDVTASGYPRAGSSLSIVILSDEPSQYTSRSGNVQFDTSVNLFVDRGYRVYSIINTFDDSVSQYDDLALSTGGGKADINDLTVFPQIMQQIATNAGGSASSYILASIPVSSTLSLVKNGVEMTRSSTNGWQYISASNSIVFYGAAMPLQGDSIEVVYAYF